MSSPGHPPDPTLASSARAPSDDEAELIRRCQGGDVAAFEPLVEKYRHRVWRLAYRIVRDREEAWDCAQEAFVRAFHSIRSFHGRAAFYTWLFRIAVNVATDRLRARGARTRALGAEPAPGEEWERTTPDPGEGPDLAALRAERRAQIRRALESLPVKSRTIIMLSDIEGLSYREIAEVLDCPIGTVMSRLHNARKRLRALLGPMLGVLLLAGALLAAVVPVEAQPVIRFGVRVLEASNAAAIVPPPATLPGQRGAPWPGQRSLVPPTPLPLAQPEAEQDERLRRILPRLRTLFRYNEYTTIERHRAQGTLGIQHRFPIPGERWLEVTPDEMHGDSVRMLVRLLKGERSELRTAIVAAPGAPAVLGGPPYGNGVLIIILWAHPEAGTGSPDR